MAATELSVQTITRDGLEPAYTAANADGHYFANNGENVFLHIVNGGAGAITATVVTTYELDEVALADRTVNVPAGATRRVGPFPNRLYRAAHPDGTPTAAVNVTFSDVTSVTIGALQLPGV